MAVFIHENEMKNLLILIVFRLNDAFSTSLCEANISLSDEKIY